MRLQEPRRGSPRVGAAAPQSPRSCKNGDQQRRALFTSPRRGSPRSTAVSRLASEQGLCPRSPSRRQASPTSQDSTTASCGLDSSGGAGPILTPRTSSTSSCVSLAATPSGSTFWQSLHLASEGAAQSYIRLAERFLEGDDAAQKLQAASALAGFSQALVRQGVELDELLPGTSKLSQKRRVELLAAVMQEFESLRQWATPHSPRARVALQRVEQQHATVLELQQRNQEQCDAVRQRQAELFSGRLAIKEENLLAKAEQVRRFRVEQARLREEQGPRDESRQRIYDRANELEEERLRGRSAFLEEREEALARSLSQRADGRQEMKERLRHRFELVHEGCEAAIRFRDLRMEELREKQADMMRRSEEHQEACREQLQVKVEERRERRNEREHQVLRVQRMHEAQRFVRFREVSEDKQVFAEMLSSRNKLQTDLSQASSASSARWLGGDNVGGLSTRRLLTGDKMADRSKPLKAGPSCRSLPSSAATPASFGDEGELMMSPQARSFKAFAKRNELATGFGLSGAGGPSPGSPLLAIADGFARP